MTWTRDGKELKSPRFIAISSNFTLAIKNVTYEDTGMYECIAANELGQASANVVLTVGRK
jgi:hypothetical protein